MTDIFTRNTYFRVSNLLLNLYIKKGGRCKNLKPYKYLLLLLMNAKHLSTAADNYQKKNLWFNILGQLKCYS